MVNLKSELTGRKKGMLTAIAVVFVMAEVCCGFLIQNHALRLNLIYIIPLIAVIAFLSVISINTDHIKSFFHSPERIILSVVFIACLIVSFLSVLIKVNSSSTIRTELILIFITVLLLGICLGVLSDQNETRMHQFFAVSFVILSFLFNLAVPIGEVPDEQSHLETAYQLSDKMMGESSDNPERLLMRKDDANFQILQKNVSEKKYENYLSSASAALKNENPVSVKSHALKKTDELYVFPALGITLGRILHLNSFWTFNLGRIGNLIFVCVLITLAMEIIPVGKNILFLICLMPTSLQQSMSYSYDAPINAFGMLLIAYCIRKIYETDYHPSWIRKILLIIGTAIILKAKSHAYFLLAVLTIIVWLRSRSRLSQNQKDRLIKYITIALIIFSGLICLLLVSHVTVGLIPEAHSFPEWADGKEGFSLWYIADHPGTFFSVIAGTIRYAGVTYFTTFFGKWLGWFEINTGNIPIVLLFFALILSVLSEKEKLTKKDGRVLCWIISIGMTVCVFMGFLLSYTTIDAAYIEGVQGRYFIFPVTLLLTAIAGKVKKRLDVPQVFYIDTVLICAGIALFKILAFYAGV